jgi:hypothetical protein
MFLFVVTQFQENKKNNTSNIIIQQKIQKIEKQRRRRRGRRKRRQGSKTTTSIYPNSGPFIPGERFRFRFTNGRCSLSSSHLPSSHFSFSLNS